DHCQYPTFFFFSSRRRHTRFSRDWSSDVCSSDLYEAGTGQTGIYTKLGHTRQPVGHQPYYGTNTCPAAGGTGTVKCRRCNGTTANKPGQCQYETARADKLASGRKSVGTGRKDRILGRRKRNTV